MKAKLEFDLDDFSDRKAHKRCVSATDAYIALHKIANEIFRPNRKHGYEKDLEDLFEQCDSIKTPLGFDSDAGTEIVSKLESKFYNILEELGLDLDDLE
jgi:hypothetical protein